MRKAAEIATAASKREANFDLKIDGGPFAPASSNKVISSSDKFANYHIPSAMTQGLCGKKTDGDQQYPNIPSIGPPSLLSCGRGWISSA